MSKKQVTTKSALSESTKRAIYIAAIIAIAIVIISVSLALILKPTEVVKADDSDVINSEPTDTIKNGTFESWVKKNLDESYPHLASKWWAAKTRDNSSTSTTTTTLKETLAWSSDSRDVNGYRTANDAVYGVIDTSDKKWDTVKSDLAKLGVELPANPGVHETAKEDDTSIYMIAGTKETTIGILSNSFSVSGGSYVKISMWVNTEHLNGTAKIAIQDNKQYSVEHSKELHLTQELRQAKGWQEVVFYVFNQNTSKSLRIMLSLGDIYTANVNGSGIMYVDDVTYEAVSSNEYSLHKDEINAKVFEPTEKDSKAEALVATDIAGNALTKISYKDYLAEEAAQYEGSAYSPFFPREDTEAKLYKLTNNKSTEPVGVRLPTLNLQKSNNYDILDCIHLSFSLRAYAKSANTNANIVVEKETESGKFEKIDSASVSVENVQDISAASANCGWKLYHIYLKPSDYGTLDKIRVTIYVGESTVGEYKYNGTLYLTDVMMEKVSSSTYSSTSTSSDSVVKKASLTDHTSGTSVSNGSFSDTDVIYGTPGNWTAVFGGSNDIFLDGAANTIDATSLPASAIAGSGVVQDITAGRIDDDVKNVLKIHTENTAYGYLSSSMSLSAGKVYVISVLAKTEAGSKPYIYLIDNAAGTERKDKVIASIEDNAGSKVIDGGKYFCESINEGEGWTRYYFVVVTGSTTRNVKLALMSGGILGDKLQTGTVYYDIAMKTEIGGYTATQENEDDEVKTVTYTANDGYTAFDEMKKAEDIGADFSANTLTNVKVVEPTADEWKEITKVEKKDDNKDDDNKDNDNTTTTSDVDLGLLFSVLSSVLLVAALAVVVVVRIFKKKN